MLSIYVDLDPEQFATPPGVEAHCGKRVVKRAIEAALARDADVVSVDGPDLAPLGDIAALLRF